MDVQRGIPKRLEVLILNEDEQAPSILNPTNGQMLITNSVGKRIVELTDGSRDVDAIATQIANEFRGTQIAEVLKHTETFLSEGTRKGVFTWMVQS